MGVAAANPPDRYRVLEFDRPVRAELARAKYHGAAGHKGADPVVLRRQGARFGGNRCDLRLRICGLDGSRLGGRCDEE